MLDNYTVEVMLSDMNRQIEDLLYRLSRIEESMAELSALKVEEGEIDA